MNEAQDHNAVETLRSETLTNAPSLRLPTATRETCKSPTTNKLLQFIERKQMFRRQQEAALLEQEEMNRRWQQIKSMKRKKSKPSLPKIGAEPKRSDSLSMASQADSDKLYRSNSNSSQINAL